MRLSVLAAAISLSIVGLAVADDVHASIRKETNIPAQELGSALQALAKDRNFQVIYVSEEIGNVRTHGAVGEFTSEEALKRLLEGTGLTYRYLNDRTVTIVPASAAGTSTSRPAASNTEPSRPKEDDPGATEIQTPQSPTVWNRLRVAQAEEGKAPGTRSADVSDAGSPGRPPAALEEVVVTAQKRTERLQDVPVPVTAVNAATLAENNMPRLRDFFDSVPGFIVSPAPSSGNQQMLTIRGISSGAFGNPTVGITVDDVPYGAFTRELSPDIDPSDLERVEVLRGPQGTLYGASSMGGLVKFVTVDPSTAGVSGHVQGDVSAVHNGSDLGYSFRGSVNVPLSDTIAIRASAFTRQDPGYIDNPILHTKGVNEDRVSGGRLSALWKLPEDFSLKLSALYQDARSDGVSDVVVPTAGYPTTAGLGDLQQNYIAGIGPSETKIQAYSAILKGKVANVDLTSVTGYNVYNLSSSNDYTYALGATARRLLGVGGVGIDNLDTTYKFSQEVRALMTFGERVDWLLGGFYTHEHIDYFQNVPAINPLTGATVGPTLEYLDNGPIIHKELAAFTDVTVHFTDRFNVQFGGRESHLEEVYETTKEGGLLLPNGVTIPTSSPSADVFTYLITPQFKISPDLMVYARIATGYRPGRSNANNPDPTIPRASDPDKTRNYEIGAKGDLLDHTLSFDASVYYIDWTDIQINLSDPTNNIGYFTNGSAAKSEGVELSIQARPWTGATVGVWGTYDNAVLTQGFPLHTLAYGPSGSRLPYSARYSGNLSLNQDFPVTTGVTGFAGGTLSYIGDRQGLFVATAARAVFPAYAKLDLRAGARMSSWTVNAYVNNAADKRGVLGGGAGTVPPYAYIYIQPRTVGLSLTRDF